jgi:poly(A) polymerase
MLKLPVSHLVQRIVYDKKQHGIELSQIDPDALYVMEKLREHGHRAYLVGGSVRDLLLGHTPKDFDISTSALPEEIRAIFKNCILIGRRFRLAHIRFKKKILEVATFRSGDIESDSLIVRDNQWGSEEEDVIRRDFTINGLFYDSSNETIVDYVGGYADLDKHYLRTIGQPYLRFKQDPVRMIRLVKFQARFGFEIDHDTLLALLECRHELHKSSPTRILEELLRMLELGSAKVFFQLLTKHGLLHLMLPNLAAFLEIDEKKAIFAFLDNIDTAYLEHSITYDRGILLSALIFPAFEHFFEGHFIAQQNFPHLGEIHVIANTFATDMFMPFFQIPKRLKMSIVSILTSQYRLIPIGEKRKKRPRVPQQPDFALAVQFLKIRSEIDPSLEERWVMWNELVGKSPESSPPPRRRRRRSRRKKPHEPL